MGYSQTGTIQELINLNSMGVPKADIIDYSYETDYLNADGDYDYSNLGGIRRVIKKKNTRYEQRKDTKLQARTAKKLATAEKRSGKAASLKSDATIAAAALASTKQTSTKRPVSKPIGMTKNVKIGIAVVGGLILIGFAFTMLKK